MNFNCYNLDNVVLLKDSIIIQQTPHEKIVIMTEIQLRTLQYAL